MSTQVLFTLIFSLTLPLFMINCQPKGADSKTPHSGQETETQVESNPQAKITLNCTAIDDPAFFQVPSGYQPLKAGERVQLKSGVYKFDHLEHRLTLKVDGNELDLDEVNPNLNSLSSLSTKMAYELRIKGEQLESQTHCHHFTGTHKDGKVIASGELEYLTLQKEIDNYLKALKGFDPSKNFETPLQQLGSDDFERIKEGISTIDVVVLKSKALTVMSSMANDNDGVFVKNAEHIAVVFDDPDSMIRKFSIAYFKYQGDYDLDELEKIHSSDPYPKQFRLSGQMTATEGRSMTTGEMRNESKKRLEADCIERLAVRGWYGPSTLVTTNLPTANSDQLGYEGYCSPKFDPSDYSNQKQ